MRRAHLSKEENEFIVSARSAGYGRLFSRSSLWGPLAIDAARPLLLLLTCLMVQQMFLNEVPGGRAHELDSDPVFQLRSGYFL